MRWTKWRKIAQGNEWFDEEFDYDGPACYELGIGGPRGGGILPVYVGETGNEESRIAQYARGDGHVEKHIRAALRAGKVLYYRGVAMGTKKQAKQMQDRMLGRFQYDWNTHLNLD
jgi:hypothetical protein